MGKSIIKKERIKLLREEDKLTQIQLAKILGVKSQTISNYEAGEREPSYEVLIKLADHFNVSTDYLLGRIDNKNLENAPIGEELNLTDKSIKNIKKYMSIDLLNALLENEEFYYILDDAYDYIGNYPLGTDKDGEPIYDDKIYDDKKNNYRKFEMATEFINLLDSINNSDILNSEIYKKLRSKRYHVVIKDGE